MNTNRQRIYMTLVAFAALSGRQAAAQTPTQPTPQIASLCPPATTEGAGDTAMTIYGSNFTQVLGVTGASGSTTLQGPIVDWRDRLTGLVTQLRSLFVSTSQLTVTVPASLVKSATNADIAVELPIPVNRVLFVSDDVQPTPTSNSVLFRVLPAPVITAWNPLQTTEGAPLLLMVSGQTFIPPTEVCAAQSRLLWNGEPLRTASVDRSDTMSANVPLSLITPGLVSISVLNPGGGLSKGVPLRINPRPSITTALPNGVVGTAYRTQLERSGGTSPFGWSLAPGSGALPPGLSLDAAGVVSGQPTLAGTYRFTVRLTDSAEVSATRDYTVRIFQPDVKPGVVSVCPKAATVGDLAARVTIAIAGVFQPEVDWDGKPLLLEANSVSGGTMILIARVTADLLATPGSHAITVVNLETQSRAASDPIPFRVLQPPLIASPNPQVTTEGARIRLSVNATSLIANDPACGAGSTLQWNGQALSGATLSEGQISADVPVALVVGPQATVNMVNPGGVTSNSVTITINPPPLITTSSLPNSVVSRRYPATTLQGSGGTAPLTWSMSPNIGLTIDRATGTISGTPTSAGDFDVRIELRDAASVAASRTYRVTVLPVLDLSIAGLPAAVTPGASQPSFQLQVNVPGGFPTDVRGRLTFAFEPDADLQNPTVRDPALSLSVGPEILIPAFSPGIGVLLSPGTSAGRITVTFSNATASGMDVTPTTPISVSTRIASGPPVISSCIEEKSESTLRVRTVGFSPTRELRQAVFRFAGAAGSNLKTTEIAVSDVGTRLFNQFYTGQTGLTSFNFRYVQIFSINGDPKALSAVTVVLENAKGQSAPALAAGVCADQ